MKRVSIRNYAWGKLDVNRLNPMPFPGEYPTRWRILLWYNPVAMTTDWLRKSGHKSPPKLTECYTYLGKPTREVAERVERLLHKHTSWLQAWEFDRGGVFQKTERFGPCLAVTVTAWAERLAKMYSPWLGTDKAQMITNWGGTPMHRQPVVFKGKRFLIYSPYMTLTEGLVLAYKSWLENANLKFAR